MRANQSNPFSTFHRICSLSALLLTLSTGTFGFLTPVVTATNLTETTALSLNESIVTYPWNLDDDGMPLVSLPDHIRGNPDLSFTYSMGQFQFPIFQSLYFNEQVGKYIVMVFPNRGRRAQFINISSSSAGDQPEPGADSRLLLTTSGDHKLLTTDEGTIYTFTRFDDGEFHCSQIHDRDGLVINLRYTNDSYIDNISDDSGRTIKFNYKDQYVNGITQTWLVENTKRTKTWSIEMAAPAGATTNSGYAGREESKHIPSNAIRPNYTSEMAASDSMLASIFGGRGAVAAANGFEPRALGSKYPLYRGDLIGDDGRILRGHLSFAMHLYGSADGREETAVYVPTGFVSNSTEPTPTDAAITFYYPKLGNYTDVTLAVFHVANFHLRYEDGRVRIGDIGGPGGSIGSYRHSHIEFYRGNTGLPSTSMRMQVRIDPVKVFSTLR